MTHFILICMNDQSKNSPYGSLRGQRTKSSPIANGEDSPASSKSYFFLDPATPTPQKNYSGFITSPQRRLAFNNQDMGAIGETKQIDIEDSSKMKEESPLEYGYGGEMQEENQFQMLSENPPSVDFYPDMSLSQFNISHNPPGMSFGDIQAGDENHNSQQHGESNQKMNFSYNAFNNLKSDGYSKNDFEPIPVALNECAKESQPVPSSEEPTLPALKTRKNSNAQSETHLILDALNESIKNSQNPNYKHIFISFFLGVFLALFIVFYTLRYLTDIYNIHTPGQKKIESLETKEDYGSLSL